MSDTSPDPSAPVLVTGATGYVAGWLIRALLERGLTVHAAVRDPENAEKVGHLRKMGNELAGTLELFHGDLLEPGSYDAAMAGCGIVFHTASPFTTAVEDPQRDLVDPALEGTRNVLESATRTPSVTRVVLTSSCAAIYGDNIDVSHAPQGVLTEDVWNVSSSLEHQPYSYSKTLAEREAWKIAEGQSRWQLVVINPSLVVGPGTAPRQTSESFNIVRQIADGTLKSGAPPLEIGMVDVRDVAEAHLQAGFRPDAQGRHIVSAETGSLLRIARAIRERYGDAYPVPQRELPKWLVWLIGPMVSKGVTRRMVARNMGLPWRAAHAKSRRELGLEYRSVDQAVAEMVAYMRDNGQLEKA